MTAIRPPIFPPPQPTAGGARADQTRSAAQKAFFDLAMGKSAAPGANVPPATAPAAAAPPAITRLPDAGAEKPQKILRPGSLLDIRV